ncbi:MAG TPA: BadF/BadG/BcrA/BcrD ATPase family protein [Candidatus Acidoferrales bacterium]|jgi:N-acetylglucosamine kinase-like BadF-type ATPase|nr:BadF/BadG/BcrA/BcrD ATPase family protein [Candidatus Acidoferrales bacterium]
MDVFIGFDGGGTKTDCIALDADGRIAGQGQAGASNPLRVGYDAASAALQMAAAAAISIARSSVNDVRAVCAGLAGAGRSNVAEEMRFRLARIWPKAAVQITTDADAALEAAVGEGPGVILIAGTGSVALGRNSKGELARVGGYGVWIGDPGSSHDIGRNAVAAACRARDFSGPATKLGELILATTKCRDLDELIEKIAAGPASIFTRLLPVVTRAAEEGDAAAREVLTRAALDLANLALVVIGRLGMKDAEFRVARTGGVFNRSYVLDSRVDGLILRVAPNAQVSLLAEPPALGAARLALRLAHTSGAARGKSG